MSTRDLLVEAAADLFYARGIHQSGIDAVVAHSGFSKPTLYSHFRSKHELVTAVLEMRDRARRAVLSEIADQPGRTPLKALEAIVDFYARWYEEDDYRGCALVNGAVELPDVEHPGREVVRMHKAWMVDLFERLGADAGLDRPRELAQSLALLEEGATAMATVGVGGDVGSWLRQAATTLIRAHRTDS